MVAAASRSLSRITCLTRSRDGTILGEIGRLNGEVVGSVVGGLKRYSPDHRPAPRFSHKKTYRSPHRSLCFRTSPSSRQWR